MRAQGCFFGKITFFAKRPVHLIGRNLVEPYSGPPRGISVRIFSAHPRTAGAIHKVLRTEYICLKEQLRVFYAAVHMTFCRKIYNHIEPVFHEKAVYKRTVADISTYESAAVIVYVFSYCAEISCISKCVEHDNTDVVVLLQHIFNKIRAYKTGSTGNEVSFHFVSECYVCSKSKYTQVFKSGNNFAVSLSTLVPVGFKSTGLFARPHVIHEIEVFFVAFVGLVTFAPHFFP